MKKSTPEARRAGHDMKMLAKAHLRKRARPSFRFPSKAAAKGGCPKPWTQAREAARRLRQMEARAS